MRKIIGFLAAAVIATAPAVGLMATTAYAGTGTPCSGTNCSGLDPTNSYNSSTGAECSGSASTVLSANELGGFLELRWGPNCQTNWTRFTPGNNDKYQIWVTNISTGVWAGTGLSHSYMFMNQAGVSHFSDQVYTGPAPAAACVEDMTTNSPDECVSQ